MKNTAKTIILGATALLFSTACSDTGTNVDGVLETMDSVVNSDPIEVEPVIVEHISHAGWDALLKKYVSAEGTVDYAGFSTDTELAVYLDLLKNNHPDSTWEDSESMAYWINAYNAYTVKLIVDNYPLESITNLDEGSVWNREWIVLGSTTYSLDHIENQILRPVYNDPRIHFGINCASFSCPLILNEAFTMENTDLNLEQLAHDFINDSARNQLNADAPKASQIFNWFAGDFSQNGTVVQYLNMYLDTPIPEDATLTFMDYDWNLNQ